MPQSLDSSVVRTWCSLALDALGREREEIDAINVYPVADGDTGTNLYLTVESARQAVEALFADDEAGLSSPGRAPGSGPRSDRDPGADSDPTSGGDSDPTSGGDSAPTSGADSDRAPGSGSGQAPAPADAVRAMAHGALIGARGNSGTILSQLLRGMAEVLAEGQRAEHLARALRRASDSARDAVAHPVEGTILSVAAAAASRAPEDGTDLVAVARAAYEGARTALEATPGQLAVLERAGVVDAGGRGLVTVLGALVEAVSGEAPVRSPRPQPHVVAPHEDPCAAPGGPAYEVIYLLEADDTAVARLRDRLDALGDSLVVVGGDGLWNVHVHVDDAGAAVEAGVEAGRPYRIRITHFATDTAAPAEPTQRAVVAVVPGEGLAALCEEAGATTVLVRPGRAPASGELVDAIRRAHAREVVLLPNAAEWRHTAAAAAEQARTEGVRVALIPTRAAVQGIAALAVHAPDRRFDEDVVAMTAAAGATRYGELAVAERQSFTSAGVCQAGDVLGLIDGDVAVIGQDLTDTAVTVLDRMLSAGGELVTLVLADDAPPALAGRLETHVREHHLAVDTCVYHGGRQSAPLLIGVE
ncbi:DAK2 domain-containing protein [Streptomyces sp. NPDC047928]|uniref:DAK2 domain-containing protein n=1 Tax=unclassified Streptomyces TaxID=2593676 RepID=UPI00372120F6